MWPSSRQSWSPPSCVREGRIPWGGRVRSGRAPGLASAGRHAAEWSRMPCSDDFDLPDPDPEDRRRIEILADGLPLGRRRPTGGGHHGQAQEGEREELGWWSWLVRLEGSCVVQPPRAFVASLLGLRWGRSDGDAPTTPRCGERFSPRGFECYVSAKKKNTSSGASVHCPAS